MTFTNDYSKLAGKYSKSPIKGTGYLAFRDLPALLLSNNNNKVPEKVLDFGCGAGRSSRFIKELGIPEVSGVDKSSDMISFAKKQDDGCNYLHISNNTIPFEDNYFDCVVSTFVMLEISSESEMLEIFKEIYRVLKPNGSFVFVTNSEYLYNMDWISNSTEYPKTQEFKDGDKLKIYLKNIDQELYDYYWSDKKYRELLIKANYKSIYNHLPVGEVNEPYEWEDELYYPPFSVYSVFKY